MKTKISLILLGLGLVCGSAYAAHMEETPMPVSNDINVTAPHQSGTWSFGAEAVLLQPLIQAFSYPQLFTFTDESVSHETQSNEYKGPNPGYHWWFGANITYGFAGNGRDVTLAYEGLQGSDTAYASSLGTDASFLSAPSGSLYATASSEMDTHYDAADLLFGQKLDVGQRIRLHPFIGLRYAYMNVKDTIHYAGGTVYVGPDEVPYPVEEQDTWNATFNGIGPRFGSDAAINLGQGFSVRARLGLSALIGSTNPDFSSFFQSYTDDDGIAVPTSDDYSASHGSSTHVIPEIDGRLGLNYTYDFDSSTALGVEAGWQATDYFNAIYQQSGYDGTVTKTNFGLQGPYARLQLDVA